MTVVVPIYNTERHLVECLDSLVLQDLPQVEFVCIDDGSSDSSASILQSYAKYDARFVVVRQENRGVGPTRNRGIAMARGEFVAFLDADDYYPSSSSLRELWEGAKTHDVPMCGGSFSEDHGSWIRTKFEGIYQKYTFDSEQTMKYSDYQFDYGYHRFIYATNMLREKRILFPSYIRFQDPPFFVRAMVHAVRFRALRQPTYCYRFGHQSLNWNHLRTRDLVCGLRDNLALAEQYRLYDLRNLTWDRLTREYRGRIVARIRHGDSDTIQVLLECLRYVPSAGPLKAGISTMVSEALGNSGISHA